METEVLIIGGGATGTALARDLALRGVACFLVEKDDINAGASGRNHGLLHSGARYVSNDPAAASECRAEGAILKRIAPRAISETGGYFVAVQGDDERYVRDFPELCQRCGIPVRAVDVKEARDQEVALSDRTIAVYEVPDASIDPFRLSLENLAQARRLGAKVIRRAAVVAFEREGSRIRAARVVDRVHGQEHLVEVRQVANAAGAWAASVAALAGARVEMLCSKGTLLITHGRLARRVINRLRRPSNGDILMPGGTVSVLGTTSTRVESPDGAYPTTEEADQLVEEGAQMIPSLRETRFIRAFSGVRPLVASADVSDGRALSRGYVLLDHEADGLSNFLTITGGKLTTCRLMAERAADLICARLGVNRPCQTAETPIPADATGEWTEPGHSPLAWMRSHGLDDTLLCECEMVSATMVDAINAALRACDEPPTLGDIALRSRVGKGACQGAFCAVRTLAHLYQRGEIQGRRGLPELIEFFRERWRGQQPVLWGEQLAQAELMEALHCGLFSEDLLEQDL